MDNKEISPLGAEKSEERKVGVVLTREEILQDFSHVLGHIESDDFKTATIVDSLGSLGLYDLAIEALKISLYDNVELLIESPTREILMDKPTHAGHAALELNKLHELPEAENRIARVIMMARIAILIEHKYYRAAGSELDSLLDMKEKAEEIRALGQKYKGIPAEDIPDEDIELFPSSEKLLADFLEEVTFHPYLSREERIAIKSELKRKVQEELERVMG